MSVTDTLAKKAYLEVLNEVLSIQKACINIASNGVSGRIDIFKDDVDETTLDYLSAYFGTSIKHKRDNGTPFVVGTPFLLIRSGDVCDIYINLKKESDGVKDTLEKTG